MTQACQRSVRLPIAPVPGGCAKPGRSPELTPATFVYESARRIATDTQTAVPQRQIAGRGKHRNEEIGATFAPPRETECFTMSVTMMDSKGRWIVNVDGQ